MPDRHDLLTSAVDIAAAYVEHHHARADDVPALLSTIHATLTQLATPAVPAVAEQPEHAAAVSVRKSLASREHIVSMIDGKPYKALKRHLSTNGLTSEEYRLRYGLKPDYPMVAPAYSEARSATAKALGLGRKAVKAVVAAAVDAVEEAVASKPKRASKGAAAAKAAAKKHWGG